MPRRCLVLRVFTRGTEGGNPLGVILDSSGLTTEDMQAIASELAFSETIYLVQGAAPFPKVRIFTPSDELPFAGHPLVGINYVLQEQSQDGPTSIECGIGPVHVRMEGETSWIELPLDQPVELDAPLTLYDPGSQTRSLRRVSMPLPYEVIELESSDAVRAAPIPETGMVTVYTRLDAQTVHTRFFAPSHGVKEDPATGSAAVALAASLQAAGESAGEITIHQGAEIDAPSEIALRWVDGRVSVGGSVVIDEERTVGV